MKRYGILILVIIALVTGACSFTNQLQSPHANVSGRNDYILVAPPGSSPTPTPFQPIPPTPAYIPTSLAPEATATPLPSTPVAEVEVTEEGPVWQDYSGPSVWPDVDISAPVGILSHPEGQVNILLLGSDQRPNDGGFRTDTIQLLTVNPQESTVKLTSFPRDLYVYIPGYTVQRINTAMQWGGFEAMAETMEYNFGVKPNYYVMINFWSFVDVIDSIGGIDVDVERNLCDRRSTNPNYCVSQGERTMDGETALWYVRSRYSTSDLDRGRRQQEVLDAVFNKVMSLDSLQHAPELYDIYKQNVTTDLDFNVISSLIPIAYKIAETRAVDNRSIGAAEVYNYITTSGAMVLIPVREQVLALMRQVISEP
jgi:LCP family protein required for cell wall assembly